MKLYNVSSYLPFLEKAPVIRNLVRVIDKSAVLVLPEWSMVDDRKAQLKIRRIKGLLVQPIGYVVLNLSIPEIVKIIRNEDIRTIEVTMQEVDYREVAEVLEISENQETAIKTALYPGVIYGTYESEYIKTESLITASTNGDKIVDIHKYFSDMISKSETTPERLSMLGLNEEISLDSFSRDMSVLDAEESSMVIRLRSYFEGGYTTNRVPLLVGQSAVGKSALIKSLTDEYNMRMIDIRTAFMSRLDIEGLTQKVDLGDRLESFNCPMSEFVEATDAYIDYCIKAANIVRQALESEEDPTRIENLTFALERFEEGAKTPVLLFDEVTRGEGSVRQALTKILTDKEFMGYSMKKARVIAATNAVVDDSGLPEDLFLTKDIDDVAFFDRFESIPVTVADAFDGWSKWARSASKKYSGSNIHVDILDYVTKSPTIAYDITPMVNAYESTGDMNEATTSVYPNFRTWERVSDYLYSLPSKEFDSQMICSLIGESAGKAVAEHLKSKDYVDIPTKGDYLTRAVNNGINANVPTLLISPSSMGKTSRIKKAVEDRGYTFIQVNLGQQDRLDLSGPPVKVDINRFILDKKVSVPKDVKTELMEELEKSELPKLITMRAPKSDLVKKFRDAQMNGNKVVLFYDELNRVQNPSVMSSVFEAISDHRAFGIDFDPDNVCIFAACNLGDNMGDAAPLDPAISNRFAVYWKKGYDEEDAKSFLDYAKASGMSTPLIQWLEGMSTDDLISVISSIDTRTIEISAASTRGIEDLDKFLKDSKNNSIMTGTILAGDNDSMAIVQAWSMDKSFDNMTNIMDVIERSASNWSAIRGKETYKIGNQVCTAKEIVDLFEDIYSNYRNDSAYLRKNKSLIENLIQSMMKIDASIRDRREQCVGLFLGYNASNFTSYYNQVSGREVVEIKIEDIIDAKMVDKYIAQVFRGYNRLADVDKAGVRVIEDVYNYYKNQLPMNNCRLLVNGIISRLPSSDSILNFIKAVASDLGGKDVIFECAENGDIDFAKSILAKVGINDVKKGSEKKPTVLR